VLSDPLAIIGIFMLGAAAGYVASYMKQKPVLARCGKALKSPFANVSRGAEIRLDFGMKALVVTRSSDMVDLFSQLFRELRVETQVCDLESDAIDRLSSEKFEALVLDVDNIAGCPRIVQSLQATRPNINLILVLVASSEPARTEASASGSGFSIERPLVAWQVRGLLRTVYGRMLRNFQAYFRLNIQLPVSVRRASGAMLQCTTLNLSQSGMAVRTPVPIQPGEQLSIAMAIPNTDVLLSAEGTVIWDDKHGKAGISFACTNSSAQARFIDWLQDHFFVRLETGGGIPDSPGWPATSRRTVNPDGW
jgi:hypothetical protein